MYHTHSVSFYTCTWYHCCGFHCCWQTEWFHRCVSPFIARRWCGDGAWLNMKISKGRRHWNKKKTGISIGTRKWRMPRIKWMYIASMPKHVESELPLKNIFISFIKTWNKKKQQLIVNAQWILQTTQKRRHFFL